MLPDLTFDFYEIVRWDDSRYRVQRSRPAVQVISEGHATFSVSVSVDYLSRSAGGDLLWHPDLERSDSWQEVQEAALSLIHCLNQHEVIV